MTHHTAHGTPHRPLLATLTALAIGILALPAAHAAPWRGAPAVAPPTDRIIVKWRESGVAAIQIEGTAARAARLSASSGIKLAPVRTIHERLDVMRLDAPLGGAAMRRALMRLQADPSVQYAEADERRYLLGVPNDPRFVAGSDARGQWQGQWYLNPPSADAPAGTDATTAWDTATGAGVVIAVIDSGINLHPDLGLYASGGKVLPGYDFVCNDTASNCLSVSASNRTANDGDGWDFDASDPGDAILASDLLAPPADQFFAGCGDGTNHSDPVDSTWHGTRVAGILAAITNNGVGIAGIAPDAKLLPVRVIGKCGGYMSDIVAGMYWAAGFTTADTSGVAANPYPASILNLSVGASGPCTQTEQAAVTALTQGGHLVVAAAGNDGGPVDTPANCVGALSVAGLRHVGTKVGYSSVSSTAAAITIAAPAGNCVNANAAYPWTLPCLYSIETTTYQDKAYVGAYAGTPPQPRPAGTPGYTYALLNDQGPTQNLLNEGSVGTSFAAPIVAGIAALMVQGNININAATLIARLQAAATPFPAPATPATGGTCHVATLAKDTKGAYTDLQTDDCQCTAATCGAGMVNATAALAAALRPLASVVTSSSRAAVGDSITLDGTGSVAATGRTIAAYYWTSNPSVTIQNASTATARLVFPALRPVTVTLTITDDLGRQDQASKTIDSVALKAGGGGGRIGPFALLLLLGVAVGAILARRSRRPHDDNHLN